MLKFNETFICEILVTCDLCMFRMDLLYHFDTFQSLVYFFTIVMDFKISQLFVFPLHHFRRHQEIAQ